ncbi:MAG: hypothetical protein WKF84_14095 [Pyrinomonadaceae bacterium]
MGISAEETAREYPHLPLGRELMKMAEEIGSSDEPALDEEAVENELKMRRGGYAEDGE